MRIPKGKEEFSGASAPAKAESVLNENPLELQIENLQKELGELKIRADENSQIQWRMKRAEMARAQYEAFIY